MRHHRRLLLVAPLAAALASSGCFPLAATGVAVGALAVIDRRTVGAQAEDEAIELKAANRVRSAGLPGRISVASHNRRALIVGQVPDEATRQRAEQIVQGVENLRGVHNELQVGGRISLTTQSSDTIVTTKVKAAYVDAKDLQVNTIKVITENGVVYLMGLVTQREAERAAQVASRVGGVQRVVTVFELISEEERTRLDLSQQQQSAPSTAGRPAPAPAPAPAR